MRDAHKILSVGRNATMQEIKMSYRRLALQLHPDTNGGDADKSEQFKKVNEAYSYLTDPRVKEDDIFDDFEQYAYSSHRPQYTHSTHGHWNPFQSPFQNMKNAEKAKKNNNSNANPFGDFDEWDDFDFIDFATSEEVVFGFDKKGKARSSRKASSGGKKKQNAAQEKKTQRPRDAFSDFTTEEIEDIIRNSTRSAGDWGQGQGGGQGFSQPNRRRSNSSGSGGGSGSKNSNNSSNNSSKGKGSVKNGGSQKGTKSRRRRRGGDDCTIS